MNRQDLDDIPIDQGANGPVRVENGGTVHVYRPPFEKWRIRFYERGGCAVFRGRARMFEWLEAMPEVWKKLEFDTAQAAAAFVQQQVTGFRVPAIYGVSN